MTLNKKKREEGGELGGRVNSRDLNWERKITVQATIFMKRRGGKNNYSSKGKRKRQKKEKIGRGD